MMLLFATKVFLRKSNFSFLSEDVRVITNPKIGLNKLKIKELTNPILLLDPNFLAIRYAITTSKRNALIII